jgi:alkylhydroperoxidase family enzyme
VGLTDEQISAVDDGAVDASEAFDDLQRAVLRFTREVVAGPKVAEPTFAAVSDRLTPREVVELLLTIGDYLMIARLMTTLELDLDEAVGLAVTDATSQLLDR